MLRDYQQRARDAILAEWESGVRSTLVVLPTGSGKTVLFADIIKSVYPVRALVFAHREELIWQARDKIERFTGLGCEIEMGELSASPNLFNKAPVIISTIQTQTSKSGDRYRMSRFDPKDFGLIIIDECHHGTAQTYRNVTNYYLQNPNTKMLGVTATPDRADEEALGQIFETVAFDYEILDAIHDGWLVPIDQQMVHIDGLDFSAIKTTAGDLNGGDLAEVMEAERNLLGVASAAMSIIGEKKGIVFCASVKQSESLSDIFNRHAPGSASWICGKTPKDQRRQILSEFSSGKIRIVCNCGVLTEGFDEPGVEVVVMARPTKSRSLYSQMCGRSMRPLPGIVDGLENREQRKAAIESSPKKSCLIVDFVGNSGKHKLMTTIDILGGKVSDKAMERALLRASKLGRAVRTSDLLDEEEENIKAAESREKERIRRLTVIAKAKYNTRQVNPFDVLDLDPVKSRGWDNGKVLSEKQRGLLLKQGINPMGMPYAQARQLIGEIFNRWHNKKCTYKQAALLKRFGYTNTNITMNDAKSLIDKIAAAGWKRPDDAMARQE